MRTKIPLNFRICIRVPLIPVKQTNITTKVYLQDHYSKPGATIIFAWYIPIIATKAKNTNSNERAIITLRASVTLYYSILCYSVLFIYQFISMYI